MVNSIKNQILSRIKSETYRPQKQRALAKQLNLADDAAYETFKEALAELVNDGQAIFGPGHMITVPNARQNRDEIIGVFRQNKRGFGFVIPQDAASEEDLYIGQGDNAGAITGDRVRARIINRGFRDGKEMISGRIVEVVERKNKRFVGSIGKLAGQWVVFPDGNVLTAPILAPDAASRNIKLGTKVVVELTTYPGEAVDSGESLPGVSASAGTSLAQGVITEVLGHAHEKDVDLRAVIIQHNLPGDFPDAVKAQARESVDRFNPADERSRRLDLSDQVICTIDPDDAKDYDDAISLRQLNNGHWELGVHIADVSHFVTEDSEMDIEARERGNSTYFPGYVIPMLPEILSNGVCSLQEGVPRLCKSAFITLDDDARPISAKFANTIIKSRQRFRYKEAQAIIDDAQEIPHPDGPRKVGDYPEDVVQLLHDMNALSRRIQKRRQSDGQIVLDLPEVDLVLDENGQVVDAVQEDQSFTHTLIEMFMVEANEAVARLFTSLNVPHLRRTHPEPEGKDSDRLRNFAGASGHRLPREMDRKSLQALLASIRGKPEAFAINLAVLKSLSRAEYSPKQIGHYALASEDYCHFTSPIRRYADLTIHRLLDAYFDARGDQANNDGGRRGKVQIDADDIPSYDDLVQLGKHLSVTERRSEDAERELRQVKLLTIMQRHVGEQFPGVVTGITNFGIFVQLDMYLVDGLIRYEDMAGNDYWEVDERSGTVRGRRSQTRISIGDVVKASVVKVDVPRRELTLALVQLHGRGASAREPQPQVKSKKPKKRGKSSASSRGPSKPRGKQPKRAKQNRKPGRR